MPWQIVAGILKSELKVDTTGWDIVQDWVLKRLAPTEFAMFVDVNEFLGRDPGVGMGSIHNVAAQHVSTHFAEKYPGNTEMQLDLHGLSKVEVLYTLVNPQENLRTVAAFVRQLADYRFGANSEPDLSSHADLSEWTLTDAVAIWHAYRAGVHGLSPDPYGVGFESVPDFQDRGYTWEEGLYGPNRRYFGHGDVEESIVGALPYLRCYLENCD